MPSPFPGMDPYLERPSIWPAVHPLLMSSVCGALNAVLPASYFARMGERLYVVQPERSIYPDVVVVERPAAPTGGAAQRTIPTTTSTSDPPYVVTVDPREIKESYIEICAVDNPHRIITGIEVLSPTNKAGGSPGRELYLKKQQEMVERDQHLLEIDLLRRGPHTVSIPQGLLDNLPRYNYLVSLHRGDFRWRWEVWPITMRQHLPRIHVPLADADPDVVVDLQPILDRCYDEGAFSRQIDYHAEPDPPLGEDDARWADALLRDRGLR